MKNKFKFYVVAWFILVAIFNVVAFVTPCKISRTFWIGYIFITLSFIGQLVCAYVALKAENSKKLFLNLPLITISHSALILSIIVGTLFMAIPNLPIWIGVIGCVLILGFNVIAIIKAAAAAETVNDVENKVAEQTEFIRTLTAEAQNLMNRANAPMLKNQCKKVYEALRYSDPVSNENLSDIENQIKDEFSVLSDAIISDDLDLTESSTKEILELICQRNNQSKLYK